MGNFEKILAYKPLRKFLSANDDYFIEERGWQDLLRSIPQLKNVKILKQMIKVARPKDKKAKIIKGFFSTLAAENSSEKFECEAYDYAGCFLQTGQIVMRISSKDSQPNYVGFGMNIKDENCFIKIIGEVGDFLGYKSQNANIELKGNARDKAAMAIKGGKVSIAGNVAGSVGGNISDSYIHVDKNVGRIAKNNHNSSFIIQGDINWNIEGNIYKTLIRVDGDIGMSFKEEGKYPDICPYLSQNSIIIVGGNIYGNIGKRAKSGMVFVWGKVNGKIDTKEIERGYIYLNSSSTSVLRRIISTFGLKIKIKKLPESGYLYINKDEDLSKIL
jgi:formylmethanofuran dehydrogenase subunit C